MSVRERQIVLEPKFDCGTTACLQNAFARVFICTLLYYRYRYFRYCTSTFIPGVCELPWLYTHKSLLSVPAFSYQEFVNNPKL